MTKTVNIPDAACPFCGEKTNNLGTSDDRETEEKFGLSWSRLCLCKMEVSTRHGTPVEEARVLHNTRSIPAAIQTLTHAATEGKLSDDDKAKLFGIHGRCYQCVHWVGDRQEAERISKQGPIALDIMRGWMPFGLCNELIHEVTSVTVNGDASVKLEIYGGAYCPLFVPLPADKEQP